MMQPENMKFNGNIASCFELRAAKYNLQQERLSIDNNNIIFELVRWLGLSLRA